MVRATRGSFSGPMTISATAPISAILSKPKSITRRYDSRLGLGLDVHRVRVVGLVARDLLRRRHRRVLGRLRAALHAVLEALDRGAQIAADVLQLLGAEDQHDDQQHDQPMPDAETTHDVLLKTTNDSRRTGPERRAAPSRGRTPRGVVAVPRDRGSTL